MRYIAIILLFICNICYSCQYDVQSLSWLMFKKEQFSINNQRFNKQGNMFVVNSSTVARQSGNMLYDCNGILAARLAGNMVYSSSGSLMYRYVGDNVYDSSGKLMYMFHGSIVVDKYGKTYN